MRRHSNRVYLSQLEESNLKDQSSDPCKVNRIISGKGVILALNPITPDITEWENRRQFNVVFKFRFTNGDEDIMNKPMKRQVKTAALHFNLFV